MYFLNTLGHLGSLFIQQLQKLGILKFCQYDIELILGPFCPFKARHTYLGFIVEKNQD